MLKSVCLKGLIMEIVSKIIEIKADLPVDNDYIEKKIHEMGIEPLRWAVVKVGNGTLTVSLAYDHSKKTKPERKSGFFRNIYDNL